MTPTAITKTRVASQVGSQTAADVLGECSFAVVGGVAVLAGLWSVACFVAGLLASGGPFALARSWFTAVSGI